MPDDRITMADCTALAAADEEEAYGLLRRDDRHCRLIRDMPTALWQVDARPAGEIIARLKAQGISDIAALLEEQPALVERTQDLARVTEANHAAVSLFRARDASQLIGPVRYLFAATPAMAARVMVAHFEGRRSYSEQAKIAAFDGEVRDVVFSVTFPAAPEQLDTAFITMHDITEQLRTEAQLRQLEADFAHAARISTLGELASSIAHEVNQPLAAIVTYGEASLRWLSRDEPNIAKVVQLMGRMVASARHASDVIQRIRTMAGKHRPERQPVDLDEVVAQALMVVRHDIDARGIALSVERAAALPKVMGDRVQLQQVIVNLLVNSIQAIAQAAPPQRRIALSTDVAAGGALALSIRDTGPGIAEADLARVFESFFSTKEGGMGIGLAICKSIIAAHGGDIAVANHPDGGAQFRLSLPAVPQSMISSEARLLMPNPPMPA